MTVCAAFECTSCITITCYGARGANLCLLQIISVTEGSGACGGMPELLLTASIALSIICLFVFPCVLICTVPAIAVSVAVSS